MGDGYEVRKVSELPYSIRDPPRARVRASRQMESIIYALINRDRKFTDHTDYADHESVVLLAPAPALAGSDAFRVGSSPPQSDRAD